MSNPSLQYFFDLPLPLLKPSIANLSYLYTGLIVHLLHVQTILASNAASCPTSSRISLFLVLSLLVCHASTSIFSSPTLSLNMGVLDWPKLNPFNIAGLTITLFYLPFKFWWNLFITQDSKCEPPFHIPCTYMMSDIIINVPISLDDRSKVLKRC